MFLKLSEKSFLKKMPDSNLVSIYKKGVRDAIKINDTALDILSYCDGTYTLQKIIDTLKEKYNEKEKVVKQYVEEFLSSFIAAGLIESIEKKSCINNLIRGSSEIYYPDILIWEITDYCPLKCRHCYLPKKNNNTFSKKDIDEILNIIDKSGVYQIQLTGGEALTHPELNYIVDNLIDRGIIVSISSSGIILNNNILDCLKKLKKVQGSSVRISLDGNEKTHNYIRRNENSYKNALYFMEEMKKHKIPCQVGTTVINQTKEELEELTEIVKNYGVCLIEMGSVSIQGDAKKNQLEASFKPQELNEFLKYLNDKYSDNNFTVKVPLEKAIIKTCGAGCQIIVIKANKDITICPTAEFKLGNMNEESIEDIMEKCGLKFRNIVSPNEEYCGECKNSRECRGCISRALVLKNTVDKCPWFESQHECLSAYVG